MTATTVAGLDRRRAAWRAVAVPTEHGGWGLTLEPAILGLLIAPSGAGVALGVAAFVTFLVRTPLKLVMVDHRRHRWLARTRLAALIVATETALLVGLALVAGHWAGWRWLIAVGLALPFAIVQMWFDVRSRGRRLAPELAGAVGIGTVVAAIAIAGGETNRLAVGLWLVIASRAVASIPFARVQIERLRHGTGPIAVSDRAQVVGIVTVAAAVVLDRRVALGAIAVAALVGLQTVWVRRPPIPAKILGMRQLFLGLGVVVATAIGVLAS